MRIRNDRGRDMEAPEQGGSGADWIGRSGSPLERMVPGNRRNDPPAASFAGQRIDRNAQEEDAAAGLLVVLLRSLWHWSQTDLANASGIQKSQISLYELGETTPSEVTLRRLAAAARVTWAEADTVLLALRVFDRAIRSGGHRQPYPDAQRIAATVGRTAAGAFRQLVIPFLRERLPILAGLDQPASAPQPDREAGRAAPGLLIVLLRSMRHWSQEELANASRVQRSQISAYELWKKTPGRKTIERLATAAGVPLDAALALLPFLRGLHRAAYRGPMPMSTLPETIGRIAEDFFLLAPSNSKRIRAMI